MSRYCVKVFVDDSNEIEWKNLIPDEIHHIDFKGKRYDEVRYGRWIDDKVAFYLKCSECGCCVRASIGEVFLDYGQEWNYCPNCGTRMLDKVEE